MDNRAIFTPVRRSDIPFYEKLSDYDWVKDFVKGEAIQEQIIDIKKEKREMQNQPRDVDSFIEQLQKECQKYSETRLQKIADLISRNRINPADFFVSLNGPVKNLPSFVTCEEITQAAHSLHDNIGIPESERQKRLEKLDKKLAKLSVELGGVSSNQWFQMRDGKAVNDIRTAFVEAWREVQGQIAEPCTPAGRYLGSAADPEQSAWKALDLHLYLNRNARFWAYPSEEFRD